MDHPRIEEMIATYALGSVDEADARAVDRELIDHLSGCISCQSLFRDLRDVSGDLALAADPRPVSAETVERLMAAVRGDRRAGSAISPSRRNARLVRLLAAASLVIVATLAAMTVRIAGRLDDANERVDRAQVALGYLSDPSAKTVPLVSDGPGRMTIAVKPDGRALLVGSDLRIPDGHVLEIWHVRGTSLIPGPTFVPEDGRALVEFTIDRGGDDGLAITVERTRVQRPTAAPIFSGSFAF